MSRKEIWNATKHQARNAVYAGAVSYTIISVILWAAPYTNILMVGAMRMVLFLTIVIPPVILLVGGVMCISQKDKGD